MSVLRIQNGLVSGVLLGLAATLSGCGLQGFLGGCSHQGSGAMKTITRNFSEYSQISLSYDISAEVTVADRASFTIDIYENVAEYLDMHVESGVLSLTFNTPGVCNSKAKATVTVTEPLQGATLSGSGNLNVDLLKGFVASVGSGSVSIGKLSNTYASIQSSGSGSLALGAVEAEQFVVITSSGSGSVSLQSLEARSVSILSTGSGGLAVLAGQASQSAEITSSGSGSVSLGSLATPAASIQLTGSGSVTGLEASKLDFQLSGSGDIQTTVTDTVSGSCSGSGSASIAGGATESGSEKCFGRRLTAV